MRFSISRWVSMVTVAESLGFLVPMFGLALATVMGMSPWVAWVTVAIFGAGEGALLGLGQAEALHRTEVAVPFVRWVAATALAATFAWSLGMLPSTLGDAGIALDLGNPLVWVTVVAGGMVLLLSIPTAQYRILRGRVRGAWQWIPVNAGAWAAGLMFTFVPSPFIDETTPGWMMVLAFAVAGVCMAATVATITGLWWRRVVRSSNRSRELKHVLV